jgi:toxin ParE1/3/4
MPSIELAPEVLDDFDRFFEHLALFGIEDTADRIGDFIAAIQILAIHS